MSIRALATPISTLARAPDRISPRQHGSSAVRSGACATNCDRVLIRMFEASCTSFSRLTSAASSGTGAV
jgi:hypothetical protein